VKVLFVCTGNTCRSPLAEAIAHQVAAESGRADVTFSSAGTHAGEGAPATDEALLVGLERGVDLSSHRSRRLTRDLLADQDLVLVMSESHLGHVKSLLPGAPVEMLAGFGGAEGSRRSIADPFGGDLAVYRDTADELERELKVLLERIPAR
jgi:protein-tyrosine-phosphatase